ncbi:MAG: IS982 family transposase, partial [Candidatus Electrothrix sp. AUS1_2]|nr:IS982 family transposase [Candidatus Electrothrix sp. AUS1_2]
MELQITTFYVLCCELLSALNICEAPQTKMNNAEVMTVVLTAARFFGGNFRTSAQFPEEHGYIPDMLSESRLNRRIHALDADIWETLFLVISEAFKNRNTGKEYILDSFPVPICDNIRIGRSKIFQGKEFRGYMPSKRRYFDGFSRCGD